MDEVVSPCISICELDAGTGFCKGCWRTRDEIAGWRAMNSEQRLQVLSFLHDRRADAGLTTRRVARRRKRV